MLNNKSEVYVEIAKRTGNFTCAELEVLKEILEDYQNSPNINYFIFESEENNTVTGFIVFGKTPMTKISWDIYWLVVDKDFQGKGFGKKLLQKTEEFIVQQNERLIFRVETSSKKEYAAARGFYTKTGFKEAGRIHNFYNEMDDLVIFSKQIDKLYNLTSK